MEMTAEHRAIKKTAQIVIAFYETFSSVPFLHVYSATREFAEMLPSESPEKKRAAMAQFLETLETFTAHANLHGLQIAHLDPKERPRA